jgi:hypothetical protein
VGLIGTPNSHNSIQSISGMLASDFSPYSFVSTPPTTARAGRDYGLQARGYVLGEHVEYRAGAFQGYRGPRADHELRYVGRVVADAFVAEKSVYYAGTSLGVRRSLAIGAGIDHQEHYSAVNVDLYADQPLPNGDAVTVQADWVRYDGGTTFLTFPRQHATLLEAGYFVKRARVTPFVQIARDNYYVSALADQEQRLAGLAYWIDGHHLNLKAAVGRLSARGARTADLLQLTFQSWEY